MITSYCNIYIYQVALLNIFSTYFLPYPFYTPPVRAGSCSDSPAPTHVTIPATRDSTPPSPRSPRESAPPVPRTEWQGQRSRSSHEGLHPERSRLGQRSRLVKKTRSTWISGGRKKSAWVNFACGVQVRGTAS